MRTTIAALALAALIAFGAAPARASGGGINIFPDEAELAQALLTTTSMGFGLLDVAFLIAWRPMPPVLAFFEMTVAGILMPAIALSTEATTEQRVLGWTSAVWFTGHGFTNLVIYPDYARERARQREEQQSDRQRYGLALQPRQAGTSLHLYAVF